MRQNPWQVRITLVANENSHEDIQIVSTVIVHNCLIMFNKKMFPQYVFTYMLHVGFSTPFQVGFQNLVAQFQARLYIILNTLLLITMIMFAF